MSLLALNGHANLQHMSAFGCKAGNHFALRTSANDPKGTLSPLPSAGTIKTTGDRRGRPSLLPAEWGVLWLVFSLSVITVLKDTCPGLSCGEHLMRAKVQHFLFCCYLL